MEELVLRGSSINTILTSTQVDEGPMVSHDMNFGSLSDTYRLVRDHARLVT